ncbi:MAG: hypothetical protein ACYST6_19890, partial [Planctomycetota bacterium]
AAPSEPKQVKKEGLSEYFLYTIEGTETIPTGWSKRLLSFDIDDVPVVNLYKYEEERYGNSVVRFLSFKNAIPELQERPGARTRRDANPRWDAEGLQGCWRCRTLVLYGPIFV